MKNFEASLLESGDLIRRASIKLINNAGRAIAVITLIVATLVTFTDLSFSGFGAKNFTATVIIMLTASYLIYFSMEDTGEKSGEDTQEYKLALSKYKLTREKIAADKIDALRVFCHDYSLAELEYRITSQLAGYGESRARFNAYLEGERNFSKRSLRAFRRAAAQKAVSLTPKTLLSKESLRSKSELSNPEAFKLLRLFINLIPTTVCMILTVSIIPSIREDMSLSAVIESILKLSSLPIIGLRGFIAGYTHVKERGIMWLETKTRLLEAFLAA